MAKTRRDWVEWFPSLYKFVFQFAVEKDVVAIAIAIAIVEVALKES